LQLPSECPARPPAQHSVTQPYLGLLEPWQKQLSAPATAHLHYLVRTVLSTLADLQLLAGTIWAYPMDRKAQSD